MTALKSAVEADEEKYGKKLRSALTPTTPSNLVSSKSKSNNISNQRLSTHPSTSSSTVSSNGKHSLPTGLSEKLRQDNADQQHIHVIRSSLEVSSKKTPQALPPFPYTLATNSNDYRDWYDPSKPNDLTGRRRQDKGTIVHRQNHSESTSDSLNSTRL